MNQVLRVEIAYPPHRRPRHRLQRARVLLQIQLGQGPRYVGQTLRGELGCARGHHVSEVLEQRAAVVNRCERVSEAGNFLRAKIRHTRLGRLVWIYV
jgi:hypothetical protein